ncbi:RTA1 domain protein [Cordyceps militaris CM01]|uniref:RTA1 domain protein n=1 Tax=Cordyceps militaris (strain CM01) TaxID=983644 RepID=G3J4A1_CORMM|nr:RTA1 domain protein [Cordyceps militaris CM01]EGX95823.1 RTA1 domain protein [Cordyceps militaris CM01]
MVCGLLLEMLGYIAKVQLAHSRTNKNAYIMYKRYIIGLTLGPTFLSSSLYLGIGGLQRRYQKARFGGIGPRWFASLFILGDFACLCFIGCGGSLAAIFAESPVGVDLMIAGLATQVLCTAVFCLLLFFIYRRVGWPLNRTDKRWYLVGELPFFSCFAGREEDPGSHAWTGAAVAAGCLFVRSCWRVAELSDGFNGRLASEEGAFIALDSVPMVIMSFCLTLLHPQYWFGRGGNADVVTYKA